MCRSATNGMNPKTIFHLFHQWGQWEQYVEMWTSTVVMSGKFEEAGPYSQKGQLRTCNRCGKLQDKLI